MNELLATLGLGLIAILAVRALIGVFVLIVAMLVVYYVVREAVKDGIILARRSVTTDHTPGDQQEVPRGKNAAAAKEQGRVHERAGS